MVSPLEAFVPENDISIGGVPCKTPRGRDGGCTIIVSAGDPLYIDFVLLSESEVSWKSYCTFTFQDRQTNSGTVIANKGKLRLELLDIAPEGEICSIGFIVLDTERDADDVLPNAAGSFTIVHAIVGSPKYISLPRPQIRIRRKTIEVKGSRFTKWALVGPKERVEKLHEFAFDKPKKNFYLRSQSDNGRKTKQYVRVK